MEPIHILLVEDNPGDLFLLKELLQQTSLRVAQVHEAPTLKEALALIHEQAVHLVLLDLFLPDSHTMNTFQEIKKHVPAVPVIVLSGLADTGVALETVTQGAQDYLIKGEFDAPLLEKVIQYSFERQKNIDKLRISEANLRAILNAKSDSCVLIDSGMRVVAFNKSGFMRLARGRRFEASVFLPDFLEEDQRDEFSRCFLEAVAGERSEIEKWEQSPEGIIYWYLHTYYPVYSETGEIVGVCYNIQDITASKKAQEELVNAILNAQETEKNRFARDLHDGLGQVLVAIKLNLNALEGHTFDENESGLLENAKSLLDQAISDTRSISHNLMPNELDKYGLRQALEGLKKRTEVLSRLRIELDVEIDENLLSKNSQINIYRIVQEFTANTLKYAAADDMSIRIFRNEAHIELVLSDNGHGFNVEKTLEEDSDKNGIGLRNILNRVKLLNGKARLQSSLKQGTSLSIKFPVDKTILFSQPQNQV